MFQYIFNINLKRISTYFRFEDFSWMHPRVIDNAVMGHIRPAGLQLDHTGIGYSLWHFLEVSHWTLKTGMICAKK